MNALKTSSDTTMQTLFENLPKLMSIEEAAAVLKVAPQTVKNWIGLRKFPHVKIGRRHMILRSSMEAWVEEREFKPWQSQR